MGSTEEILGLRERSAEVLGALDGLEREVLSYLGSSDRPAAGLRSARASAAALCAAIGEYSDLICLDRAPVAKVEAVVLEVFEAAEKMSRLHQSAAH